MTTTNPTRSRRSVPYSHFHETTTTKETPTPKRLQTTNFKMPYNNWLGYNFGYTVYETNELPNTAGVYVLGFRNAHFFVGYSNNIQQTITQINSQTLLNNYQGCVDYRTYPMDTTTSFEFQTTYMKLMTLLVITEYQHKHGVNFVISYSMSLTGRKNKREVQNTSHFLTDYLLSHYNWNEEWIKNYRERYINEVSLLYHQLYLNESNEQMEKEQLKNLPSN